MFIDNFIPYSPASEGNKYIFTRGKLSTGIWQQLVLLRYRKGSIHAQEATASWVDQAKAYYLDAEKCDWRSSGLLYYYSFLNLAKVVLVSKGKLKVEDIQSKHIYHGLHSSDKSSPSSLLDYEITICPPPNKKGGSRNIFATFYEAVTNEPWPFKKDICIKLKEILGYCDDISAELEEVFKIKPQPIYVHSLIRIDQCEQKLWFELMVGKGMESIIISEVKDSLKLSLCGKPEGDEHKCWQVAYGIPPQSFKTSPRVRGDEKHYDDPDERGVWIAVAQYAKEIRKPFEGFMLCPTKRDEKAWKFIPKLKLEEEKILWLPMLSDYIVAFALGSILRYQPYLLADGAKDSFLAEAWCNQAPISMLTRSLEKLTDPSCLMSAQ